MRTTRRIPLVPVTCLALLAGFLAGCADNTAPPQDGLPSVIDAPLLASVHLKGGKNAEPSFYDGGLTLMADGALSGLGNGDILVTLDAMANVTSTCTNQGGNAAPGQNPAPISVSGSVAIPDEEIKNGNTPFSVTTIAPPAIIPGAPDCPNANWTESIDDLAFTSALITVEQPAGTTVLTLSCTFDPPTSDGDVNKQDVTCN
jgi:hypothetical protein